MDEKIKKQVMREITEAFSRHDISEITDKVDILEEIKSLLTIMINVLEEMKSVLILKKRERIQNE